MFIACKGKWNMDALLLAQTVPVCIVHWLQRSTYLRRMRIKLTTLGLWDLRAASCATATMEVVRSSDAITHAPSSQLRSKLQHEVLASDTDCRALVYSQHAGAPLAFGSVHPLAAE